MGIREQQPIPLMKITSLLSYLTALSFALFLAQIVAAQDAMLTGAGFCTAFLALLVVRDYSKRSYRSVTAGI
jgi:uncharacterized MnhB-related membrane protein